MEKPYTHVELMEEVSSKGYESACSTLRENYQWLVLKTVNEYLRSERYVDPFIVAELNQITWLAICKNLYNYSSKENPEPYRALPSLIITITKHVCLNYFKCHDQNRHIYLDDLCNGQNFQDDIFERKSTSPEFNFEQKEFLEKVEFTVSDLSERQQEIVRLYYEGFSYNEIAERMETSPGNARILFFRAAQIIRNKINDKEE